MISACQSVISGGSFIPHLQKEQQENSPFLTKKETFFHLFTKQKVALFFLLVP
jgi:hypothetical protein